MNCKKTKKNHVCSINYFIENNVQKIAMNNFIVRKKLKMLQYNSKLYYTKSNDKWIWPYCKVAIQYKYIISGKISDFKTDIAVEEKDISPFVTIGMRNKHLSVLEIASLCISHYMFRLEIEKI